MQAYLFTLLTCVFLYESTVPVAPARARRAQRCTERPADASSFPVAAYDAPEPADPAERARRRAVSGHYDGVGFVSRDSTPRISGTSFLIEDWPDFPPLPAARSDAVIIGDVLDAAAYLSNDKRNVYTEFRARVDEVLKWGDAAPPARGAVTAVSRVGGVVLYPNGHKRSYEYRGWGMPRAGGRYVLFLVGRGDAGGHRILTGYEIRGGRVIPLDEAQQFERFRCSAEDAFLSAARAAISGHKR